MLSHFHLYGEQRSSGVMGRRNGPSGLRDDDDLYSASSELLHFRSTQHGSHSFLHCKYTMLPLPHSLPGGATTE